MKHTAIIYALLAVAALVTVFSGCNDCALVSPEGDAVFTSLPVDWPGVHP